MKILMFLTSSSHPHYLYMCSLCIRKMLWGMRRRTLWAPHGILRSAKRDAEPVRESEHAHKLTGTTVYDSEGEELGRVEDLYVDEQERKVRFLDVGAGGFLGLGERHFLIPIGAVSEIREGQIALNQSRDKVVNSPQFDPNVRLGHQRQRDTLDYYGFPQLIPPG